MNIKFLKMNLLHASFFRTPPWKSTGGHGPKSRTTSPTPEFSRTISWWRWRRVGSASSTAISSSRTDWGTSTRRWGLATCTCRSSTSTRFRCWWPYTGRSPRCSSRRSMLGRYSDHRKVRYKISALIEQLCHLF